jgi:hypothetical protein
VAPLEISIVNTTENALKRFKPEQRKCYSDDEFDLKFLPRRLGYGYSMSNCLYSAYFEEVMFACGCYLDFMEFNISYIGLNIPPCRYDHYFF